MNTYDDKIKKQRRSIALRMNGASIKDIASRIGISESTVSRYVSGVPQGGTAAVGQAIRESLPPHVAANYDDEAIGRTVLAALAPTDGFGDTLEELRAGNYDNCDKDELIAMLETGYSGLTSQDVEACAHMFADPELYMAAIRHPDGQWQSTAVADNLSDVIRHGTDESVARIGRTTLVEWCIEADSIADSIRTLDLFADRSSALGVTVAEDRFLFPKRTFLECVEKSTEPDLDRSVIRIIQSDKDKDIPALTAFDFGKMLEADWPNGVWESLVLAACQHPRTSSYHLAKQLGSRQISEPVRQRLVQEIMFREADSYAAEDIALMLNEHVDDDLLERYLDRHFSGI